MVMNRSRMFAAESDQHRSCKLANVCVIFLTHLALEMCARRSSERRAHGSVCPRSTVTRVPPDRPL